MKDKFKVAVIGAGPIGLLMANILCKNNIETLIFDKKSEFEAYSKAIGIMPPSFDILKELGIYEEFLEKAVKVKKAFISGTSHDLGYITFENNKIYKYILSNPQFVTEKKLYENLLKFDNNRIFFEHEFKKIISNDDGVVMDVKDMKTGAVHNFRTDFLIACDGSKSDVRADVGMKFLGGRYDDAFLMGDFIDRTDFGDDARLYFTSLGAVESFPLVEGKRRWIVQTENFMKDRDREFLENEVFKRTGIRLEYGDKTAESPFGVQHYVIEKYYNNRVIFCGDAAHVMPPIGGQGMNTGFADVEFASKVILDYYIKGSSEKLFHFLERYDFYRRKAASDAIRRASISMKIGTVKNKVPSLIRNIFIFLVLHSPVKLLIPYYFSMLTIRYKNFGGIKKSDRLLFENYDLKKSPK